MTIENLTRDERSWVCWYAGDFGRKALRLIDALQAALAQAVERTDEDVAALAIAAEVVTVYNAAVEQRDAALARAEATERLHEQALNERDTAHEALEMGRKAKVEWERLRNQAYALCRAEGVKRDRAESEAAALRAEVERLRAERDQAQALVPHPGDGSCEACGAAPAVKVALCETCRASESRLAAAEALLRRTYADLRLKGTNIGTDYDAFLSAQPAASAAHTPRSDLNNHTPHEMCVRASVDDVARAVQAWRTATGQKQP